MDKETLLMVLKYAPFKKLPDHIRLHRDVLLGQFEEQPQQVFSEKKSLPEWIFNDKELMTVAIKKDSDSYKHIGKSLKNDKAFLLGLLSEGVKIPFKVMPVKYRRDYEIVMKNVELGVWLWGLSDTFLDKRELIQTAITKGIPHNLNYASERLKDDEELVLGAVKRMSGAIYSSSERLQRLCQGKDPVKVLEALILSKQLNTELPPSTNTTASKKMKI